MLWQIPDINNLRKENFILAPDFRGFGSRLLAPLLWTLVKAENYGGGGSI
jgi:hypothetical protein